MNKEKIKKLAVCIAIPLVVGIVSSLITNSAMEQFYKLNQPALSPPGWLFPVVWTILYVLMGIASYLVYVSDADEADRKRALTLYGIQLFLNFCWPLIFFNGQFFLLALIWLIVLWFLILLTTKAFYDISKPAGYLMLPYIVWVAFAIYLNWGIYLLN